MCFQPPGQTSVSGNQLTATNGSHIHTFGTHTISLQFDKGHFQWTFLITGVSQPLLGPDFLMAQSILVDDKGQPLIDPSDFTSITLCSITAAAPYLDSIASAGNEFAKLLANFSDITTPSFANPHSHTWHESHHPKDHWSMLMHDDFPRTSYG